MSKEESVGLSESIPCVIGASVEMSETKYPMCLVSGVSEGGRVKVNKKAIEMLVIRHCLAHKRQNLYN